MEMESARSLGARLWMGAPAGIAHLELETPPAVEGMVVVLGGLGGVRGIGCASTG